LLFPGFCIEKLSAVSASRLILSAENPAPDPILRNQRVSVDHNCYDDDPAADTLKGKNTLKILGN
jgi:hypothetical protein